MSWSRCLPPPPPPRHQGLRSRSKPQLRRRVRRRTLHPQALQRPRGLPIACPIINHQRHLNPFQARLRQNRVRIPLLQIRRYSPQRLRAPPQTRQRRHRPASQERHGLKAPIDYQPRGSKQCHGGFWSVDIDNRRDRRGGCGGNRSAGRRPDARMGWM